MNINKKMIAYLLTSGISLGSLTACGYNKQILDFNKSFNIAVEKNDHNISIMGIEKYYDYEGMQSQFRTKDGLLVLTSTKQTQLIKTESKEVFEAYIDLLASDEDIVTWCSDIDYSSDLWNKQIVDFNYSFNKAIILSDNVATIVEISKWNDYEDDKIQLVLKDGTCILTNCDNIKLVNDLNANENALLNYAASLVGGIENVHIYGSYTKSK